MFIERIMVGIRRVVPPLECTCKFLYVRLGSAKSDTDGIAAFIRGSLLATFNAYFQSVSDGSGASYECNDGQCRIRWRRIWRRGICHMDMSGSTTI